MIRVFETDLNITGDGVESRHMTYGRIYKHTIQYSTVYIIMLNSRSQLLSI